MLEYRDHKGRKEQSFLLFWLLSFVMSCSEAQQHAGGAEAGTVVSNPSGVDGHGRLDASFVDPSPPHDAAMAALDAGVQEPPGAAGADAATPAQPCAMETTDSGLPGVRIQIEGERCNFAYQQPGSFRYRVELDRPIPYHVEAGTSCGFCSGYSSDAAPLTHAQVFGSAGGEVRSYCADCSGGCCPPNRAGDYQLSVQSFEGTLSWPGRVWSGPSDTATPLGDWFPRGDYFVLVQLSAPGIGSAIGSLPITIE